MSGNKFNEFFFYFVDEMWQCLFCETKIKCKLGNAKRHFVRLHENCVNNLTPDEKIKKFNEIKEKNCEIKLKHEQLRASYIVCKNLAANGK